MRVNGRSRNDVWALSSRDKLSHIDAYTLGDEYGPAPECPKCGRAIGMLQWLGAPRIHVVKVDGPPDDMFFPPGGGDAVVVSQTFLKFYYQNHATGLQGFELVSFSGSRRVLRTIECDYYRACIVRDGHIDYRRGKVVTANDKHCQFCGDDISSIESGVFMQHSATTDFFLPWNYNSPLCSHDMGCTLAESGLVFPRLCPGKDVQFGLWLTDPDHHHLRL